MTYEVLALRYGTRSTTKSDVYLNFDVYGEPDEPVGMDYYLWVVRDADRTVVVDCGFNERSGGSRGRTMLCPPVECLARVGVDPTAVDALVLTHGHYDHIGNVAAFDGCTIVMAMAEYEFWTGADGGRELFAHSAERADIDLLTEADAAGRLVLVDSAYDLAPGLGITVVGGHTPGQAVVRALTPAGTAVLASDAVHYYEEYARERPFRHVVDVRAMYRGFDVLRELTGGDDSLLVAGHDPEVMRLFPQHVPGLAVTIGANP